VFKDTLVAGHFSVVVESLRFPIDTVCHGNTFENCDIGFRSTVEVAGKSIDFDCWPLPDTVESWEAAGQVFQLQTAASSVSLTVSGERQSKRRRTSHRSAASEPSVRIPFSLRTVLGLDAKASRVAVDRAYRRLALIWHPDKCANDPQATSRFVALQEAYEHAVSLFASAVS